MAITIKTDLTAIRKALRSTYGARHYRITRDGDIHVRGTMPNTNQSDWYLLGRIDNAETVSRLGAGR